MWISSDSSAEKLPYMEQDRRQQTFLPKSINELSVKPRESKSERNVGCRITRTNPGGMDRPLLCSLHREPIGLMPIRQHRCDIRRHSVKSRLMLPPLKCSLKPMPLTLCPSKARHDLGSITSPHHGTDHLLNKNGVEGLPNVHKDDGGRKLSQLSPGTEKAARHDGKFGTSTPDSSRLRHSSRQRKPRHRGCTQHAGVHLSWTAGAQNSSLVLLGVSGPGLRGTAAISPPFHNIGALSFDTLAHKTPSARRYPWPPAAINSEGIAPGPKARPDLGLERT